MTLGALFLTSWAIGFSGAVTPGPLLVACISQSARQGFRAGWYVVVGHVLLELLLVVLLSLGLGAVLVRQGVVVGVRVLGGLMLVWMAWGTAAPALRNSIALPSPEHGGLDPRAAGARPRAGALEPALAGVAATVGGPFWLLWWATVGLSYLTLAAPLGAPGIGAFYTGHIAADLVWYSAVAGAVAGGRRLLTPGVYRIVLVACGLCLAVLGLVFVGSGFLGAAGGG